MNSFWRSRLCRFFSYGVVFLLLLGIGYGIYLPAYLETQVREALFLHDYQQANQGLIRWESWYGATPESCLLKARWHRKQSQNELMKQQLEQARQLHADPQFIEREMLYSQAQAGNLTEIDQHFAEWLQQGIDAPDLCDVYTRGCIFQHRIDDAYQILTTWQNDFPDDPQAWFLEGRLREFHSDLVRAEDVFRRAIQCSDKHAPALSNLARLLMQVQKYSEAIERYQQVIPLISNPQPALLGIAECQMQLAEYEQARNTLEQVRQLPEEDLTDLYRFLGEVSAQGKSRLPALSGRLELADENPELASKYFEQALDFNRFDYRTRYQYSLALRQVGQHEEAEQQMVKFEQARDAVTQCDPLLRRVRQNPADLEARYQLGLLMFEHISEYHGLNWLKSVLDYDPNHQQAREALKRSLEQSSLMRSQ